MRTNQQTSPTPNRDPGLSTLLRALKREKQATAQDLLRAQEENRDTATLQQAYRKLATVNGFLIGRSHQIFEYNQYVRRVQNYDARLAAGDIYVQEPKPYTGPAPAGGPQLQQWLHPRLSTLVAELETSAAQAAEDYADSPRDQDKHDKWKRYDTCHLYLDALQAKLVDTHHPRRPRNQTTACGKVFCTEQ